MSPDPVSEGMACMSFLKPKPCWEDITFFSAVLSLSLSQSFCVFPPSSIWQHHANGCNVPSWCQADRFHGRGLTVSVAYSSRNKVALRQKSYMPRYADPQKYVMSAYGRIWWLGTVTLSQLHDSPRLHFLIYMNNRKPLEG